MPGASFSCAAAIAKANLRHNSLPHLALAVLLLLGIPTVFGTANLDERTAAIPLEMLASLTGVILFTPVFAPEQPEEIRDTVECRAVGMLTVLLIRTLTAAAITALLIAAFALGMRLSGSDVTLRLFRSSFATALLLGSLGYFALGVSGNLAVGYMVPVLWYVVNILGGAKLFGKFYLFSLIGGSGSNKPWLLAAGILLTALTLVWNRLMRRLR